MAERSIDEYSSEKFISRLGDDQKHGLSDKEIEAVKKLF